MVQRTTRGVKVEAELVVLHVTILNLSGSNCVAKKHLIAFPPHAAQKNNALANGGKKYLPNSATEYRADGFY